MKHKSSTSFSTHTPRILKPELTPSNNRDLGDVVVDGHRGFGHLQAEVKGFHSKPGEAGQHAVVHESGYDPTGDDLIHARNVLVGQEGQIQQEQCHKEIY